MTRERKEESGQKLIATNRQARYNYHILESYEAGLVLKGTEVKSLREAKANLSDSFARIENGEVLLYNLHIGPYSQSSDRRYNPTRVRKLLMHKAEIKRLLGKTTEKGLTLIPIRLYFKRGIAKIELGLAKGKKLYDKREEIKRRTQEREIREHINNRTYRRA